MKLKFSILMCLIFAAFLLPSVVHAQFEDGLYEEENLDSDLEYVDETYGEDPTIPKELEDQTEGGKFVEEDKLDSPVTGEGVTPTERKNQIKIITEREMLPTNAAWGALTGFMIGGWMALIKNGSDRDTQRSLGMGVVLGSLLGVTLGMKSMFVFSPPPNTYDAVASAPPPLRPAPPSSGPYFSALPQAPTQSLSLGYFVRF